ncbi:MAG: hypothetical protein ACFFA2_07165 [Promethearchaeota archaeon]
MFNLEDFKGNEILENIVGKLNKYLNKNKVEKVHKIIKDLNVLLEQEDNRILITYILSVLAENNFNYISDDLLEKIHEFLSSPELMLNSIIILGFGMLNDSKYIKKSISHFTKALIEKNSDVRDNVHYFLQEIIKKQPQVLCDYKEDILNALSIEENNDNLYSLLVFLSNCKDFHFNELFCFKQIFIRIFSKLGEKMHPNLYNQLIAVCKILYDPLRTLNYEGKDFDKIFEIVNSQIILKKYNIKELSEKHKIGLKDFIENIKKSKFKDEEVYFYIKSEKRNGTFFYELEKSKLIDFFEQNRRVSSQSINDFLYIIESDSELNLVMKSLIKLKVIKGYFSDLGYFYPYNYLRAEFEKQIKDNGILYINKFDYLPSTLIKKIVKDISFSGKKQFLLGKDATAYYSLKTITQEINSKAAKDNTVDLRPYREILTNKSFIKLIKNLPKDYLTNYRKGTMLLTNLGFLKIEKEIEDSKILGYFSIPIISGRLNIGKVLLVDVLDKIVDSRSGIFNNDRERFYYSKYVNEKIDKINQINDLDIRKFKIAELSKELNIHEDLILNKIDENLRLIGDEIKQQEQLIIREYLDKTGMSETAFFEFLHSLDLRYLKRGDTLIFNENKIKDAEKELRNVLIDKAISQDYISLEDIDTTSSLTKELLTELQDSEKIKGIFYDDGEKVRFYTQKGIEKLIFQNSYSFSFQDLFYGKELMEKEIELLCLITEDLLNTRKIKGTFDKKNLTFSSFEVLFEQDYNIVLDEFAKMISNYISFFSTEFQVIKKILTKNKTTIFPQEIKMVQETIDRINEQYVRWRSGIEAFIRRANIQLLKKQGYNLKKYKRMIAASQKREEIKLFENDPEVQDYLDQFMSWVKRFNNIELKYGNVIFYQKRLIKDPDNHENKQKLNDLLNQLNLI